MKNVDGRSILNQFKQILKEREMIKVENWNYNAQNRSYQKHKHNIDEIYKIYYQTLDYVEAEIIHGEVIPENKKKIKFAYSVGSIMKKFNLSGVHEILFLIAQHPNSRINKCEFCNEGSIYFTRTGTKIRSCGHNGFCCWDDCKTPVKQFDRYCDEHDKRARKNDQINEDKLSPNDIITPKGYILCIKNGDLNKLIKVKLTNVKHISSHPIVENTCYFYTSRTIEDEYFTWLSASDLSNLIDEWIQ